MFLVTKVRKKVPLPAPKEERQGCKNPPFRLVNSAAGHDLLPPGYWNMNSHYGTFQFPFHFSTLEKNVRRKEPGEKIRSHKSARCQTEKYKHWIMIPPGRVMRATHPVVVSNFHRIKELGGWKPSTFKSVPQLQRLELEYPVDWCGRDESQCLVAPVVMINSTRLIVGSIVVQKSQFSQESPFLHPSKAGGSIGIPKYYQMIKGRNCSHCISPHPPNPNPIQVQKEKRKEEEHSDTHSLP